jgi:tRNA G37 N-methylase Trm5
VSEETRLLAGYPDKRIVIVLFCGVAVFAFEKVKRSGRLSDVVTVQAVEIFVEKTIPCLSVVRAV